MTVLYFIIPGRPRGKGRPRFAIGHVYTPQATTDYERFAAACARRAIADMKADGFAWSLEGAKTVEINAWIPTPKSWSKKQQYEHHMQPCCRKPDIDNLEKIVWDGINGIAYKDDSQIAASTARKRWRCDLDDVYPSGYIEVRVFDMGEK